MGASHSSSSSSSHDGTRKGRPTTSDGIDVQDYYGLLELPEPSSTHSSGDEVRRAYRRLALRYHPDKNPDDVEAANERFRLVQAAYEVLSDEQERAWYDTHREQILQGSLDDDGVGVEEDVFDEETFQNFRTGKQRPPPAPSGSSLPGLTARQLMRFLDASLCMDVTPPSADESGFYGTFRRIFERIADEEKNAAAYPGEQGVPYEELPGFAYSHTPYLYSKHDDGETTVHQGQVRDFYAVWGGFASRKGFVWRDKYRVNDAPDRRVKRAMEKENKRMRDAARREYNDTVRSLVNFVRKRDPRVKAHLAAAAQSTSTANSAEEMQRRRQAAEREMRRQEEQARAYEKQSWDAWEHGGGGGADSESEEDSEGSFGEDVGGQGQDGESDEDEEQDDDLTCYACDKTFQSYAAFANHERSNKHKKQVYKLTRDMRKEDQELQHDLENVTLHTADGEEVEHEKPSEEKQDVDPTAGLSKKAKQRLKKRIKEQEKTAAANSTTGTAEASEEEKEEKTSEGEQEKEKQMETEVDVKKSRRAAKKGGGKAKEVSDLSSTLKV